jgi:cell division protein FtsX
MNLATARSTTRAREIGVRQVVGSPRSQLICQHLTESVLYSLIAFSLAVVVTALLWPAFSDFAGKQMTFTSYRITGQETSLDYLIAWYIPLVFVGFALIVGDFDGVSGRA